MIHIEAIRSAENEAKRIIDDANERAEKIKTEFDVRARTLHDEQKSILKLQRSKRIQEERQLLKERYREILARGAKARNELQKSAQERKASALQMLITTLRSWQ